jgi:hypothetical protein
LANVSAAGNAGIYVRMSQVLIRDSRVPLFSRQSEKSPEQRHQKYQKLIKKSCNLRWSINFMLRPELYFFLALKANPDNYSVVCIVALKNKLNLIPHMGEAHKTVLQVKDEEILSHTSFIFLIKTHFIELVF